ncbi:DUF4129 domain-containing protein [Nocardioides sp.]|uniref:DUF4129 domain-containing protein n=1 Tax=Nocardioides sp. TaxID=35761 RepID=UPI00286DE1E8|nr:DUF4129 domain-containing protein [Nocardioides sp.]
MTQGEAWTGVWRVVAATLGACLLVTLVGWAALIGPSHVFTGPGPTPSSETTTTSEAPIEQVREKRREDVAQQEYGAATSIIANVIGGAIQLFCLGGMLYVAFWLARRATRAWRLRRHFDVAPDVDFETVPPGHPRRARKAMALDAEEQLRLLLDGEPRNAIVACWHRFEMQAVESGLARHPWETSSEFALRMLEQADIDSGPVSRLLDLYREARFSEHDLDESDRAAAAAALREIQAQVGARPGADRA